MKRENLERVEESAAPPKPRQIVMLDTSAALDVCGAELGCNVEQLLTPLTAFTRQREHRKFAIDNGAFAGFDADAFLRLLERENEVRHLCRWVAVPDVVGSARRTGELFEYWKYKLPGWHLAFVAQNGQEDEPIPWKHIQALFIGGIDKYDGQGDWKLSRYAKECIRTAQGMGKWVHIGRVNTPGRFEYFEEMGADSIDGTGLSRYSHMREAIWQRFNQPNLLTAPALTAGESSHQNGSELFTAEIAGETTAASTNAVGA